MLEDKVNVEKWFENMIGRRRKELTTPLLEQSSSSSNQYTDEYVGEEEIKKKLQWFFKTPYEKYNERGRKPYKLILQILKIVLITLQAILFATHQTSIVQYTDENLETFRNLFILDYDGEKTKYLYTKEDVYNHMFYIWKQYYNFEDSMVGSYKVSRYNNTVEPIYFCKDVYQLHKQQELPMELNGVGHRNENPSCYYLKQPPKQVGNITLEKFLLHNNLPKTMVMILSMRLEFSLRTNYSVFRPSSPDCYRFDIVLEFENFDLDGTMAVSLGGDVMHHVCRHNKVESKPHQIILCFIVIFICIASSVLCIRSFKQHRKLYKDAKHFFQECRYEELKFSDKLVFVSYWLVLIVLSDIFSVAGSIIFLLIDWLQFPQLYWSTSICFGLAVLFSWSGILRYLGFIKGYNVLLVTLKVSFPPIMRFIGCALFIYIGFVLCGWIVLGPYHEKFANLITSCDCLYSLLNGDDMFNTFQMVKNATPLILYFSKLYLYVFISLFIFVALSLFIGIVEESFEKINESGCSQKTRVQLFMEGNEFNEDHDENEED